VTRFLLDTNFISETFKPQPSTAVDRWLQAQAGADLFIATLTVAELWRGAFTQAPGRRRRQLEDWLAGPNGPETLFRGRILAFDLPAAMEWARLMAEGTRIGRPRSALDMVIGAIAAANQCVVATGNERHFDGAVEFVNPLRLTP
jgi:predicted nucleic acid-binding protein